MGPLILSLDALPQWTGRELGCSSWLRIEQPMIDRFADLTGDHQWIHVDVERARRERGATIAHGVMILSLLPAMRREIVEVTGVGRGLNYGMDRLRYVSPVACDARVRLRMGLTGAVPRGEGLHVTYGVTVEIEGAARPAIAADWRVLLYPAEPGVAPAP